MTSTMKQRPPSPRSGYGRQQSKNNAQFPSAESLLSLTEPSESTESSSSSPSSSPTNDSEYSPQKQRRQQKQHQTFSTTTKLYLMIHRYRIISCCVAVALFMSGQVFQSLMFCGNDHDGGDDTTSFFGRDRDRDVQQKITPQQKFAVESSSSSLRRPDQTRSKVQWKSSPTSKSLGGMLQQQNNDGGPLDCNFYLAESSIPRGGLGVFTATPIEQGQPAQPSSDICLYVTSAHRKEGTEIKTHTWQDFRFGAQWLGGDHVRGQCMGLVTMFNSMDVKQYASARPAADRTLIHTHGGLDRRKDPGAGAISYFYGASSVAKRDLEPGDELLLWDNSFGSESYDDIGGVGGFNTSTYQARDKERGMKSHYHLSVPPSRSPAWLQKYGMCMDHLRIGPASDLTMGRGAFANRFLPKGTVVAPAPVQIFYNRSLFQSPKYYDEDEDGKSTMKEEWPEELIVNYCFQPKGSSMLVFPYGQGVGAINHSRDPAKINVKINWSNHPMSRTSWLDDEISIRQFQKVQYPGSLILEYVATRHIAEDEEIFIDYGANWDEAWNTHANQWKASLAGGEDQDYQYPTDIDRSQPIRTVEEQTKDPYASNLKTVCDTVNPKRKDLSGKKPVLWERGGLFWPENLVSCDVLKRKKNDNNLNSRNMTESGNGYIPKISSDEPYLYAVEWSYRLKNEEKVKIVEVNVPHSSIGFVDKKYKSDQHLINAFRHPMEFPAELTPASWLLSNQNNQ
eukprot:CAMPEP_0113453974 /NCGR_PEP_ID=MMETSP0014_2-20120614/7628_1 /TAXON_ID=2857 /ORGANISM="Nitzschia sp." /LENGTH=734 /DNA_ID=CAMNT_0000345373 /DNA_START=445 /DNA_END=2649 /DNA_ORIENTATION=- /assembly_acc=CAM_ASM_000159